MDGQADAALASAPQRWPGGPANTSSQEIDTDEKLCKSTRGIVAAITGYLAEEGCYITDSSQFDDMETGLFFMRLTFISQEGASLEKLTAGFEAVKTRFGATASMAANGRPNNSRTGGV